MPWRLVATNSPFANIVKLSILQTPTSMSPTLTDDTPNNTSFASQRPSVKMLKMVTPHDIRSPAFDMSPRTRSLSDYFAVGPIKTELASIQEQEAPPSYQLNGSGHGRRESTISFPEELPTRRSSNGTDPGNIVSLGRKLSTSSVSSRRPRYSASLHGLELQEHAARIRASSPPPERFVHPLSLLAPRRARPPWHANFPFSSPQSHLCLGFIYNQARLFKCVLTRSGSTAQ